MNFLLFGPNGSGKGTQGAVVQKKFGVPHIETGVIFRENIQGGTELGQKAKAFIDRGELVPDDITVPMILDRLQQPDCAKGWLLDGFPRNLAQAEALGNALAKAHLKLDKIIQIVLDRDVAKKRIMGRRLCARDNNHPNNIFIEALRPAEKNGKPVCRICGCETLTTRADDQDEQAIDSHASTTTTNGTGPNFSSAAAKVIEWTAPPSQRCPPSCEALIPRRIPSALPAARGGARGSATRRNMPFLRGIPEATSFLKVCGHREGIEPPSIDKPRPFEQAGARKQGKPESYDTRAT